jgi:SpoVK/Ycf46/Vps4 family AAA+-type ATPase
MKLFSHISDIAEDEDCLVIVLIDEVESITSSRANAGLGNEPGDAVRVVNAVLTSLGSRCEVSSSARQYDHVCFVPVAFRLSDALKRRTNVLVLCTSNLLDMVDSVRDDLQ